IVVKKEVYEEKVELQLREWCMQVERMLAQATKIEAHSLIEQLDKLIDKQGTAQQQLQVLKQTGPENWLDLKGKLDNLMTELEYEFYQAKIGAYQARIEAIGWAEADEAPLKSINWT
ncbi:MAG: hypothetical protein AB1801_10965, partial [Chloroflexota bacterium]